MNNSMNQSKYDLTEMPLSDVRLRQWEKQYPGCSTQFEEVFGTKNPSIKQVSEWKNTWNESTKYYMPIEGHQSYVAVVSPGLKEEIHQTCYRIGIHPYFWDYWIKRNTYQVNDFNTFTEVEPRASFYFEEHLIMFKLAWQS